MPKSDDRLAADSGGRACSHVPPPGALCISHCHRHMGAPLAKWNVACVPRGNGAKDPKPTASETIIQMAGRGGARWARCQMHLHLTHLSSRQLSPQEKRALFSPMKMGEAGRATFWTQQSVFEGGPRHHHASRPLREMKRPSRPQT